MWFGDWTDRMSSHVAFKRITVSDVAPTASNIIIIIIIITNDKQMIVLPAWSYTDSRGLMQVKTELVICKITG